MIAKSCRRASFWAASSVPCHHGCVQKPLIVRGIEIPENELNWRFSRASGPGGQNVNKRSSRVELIFDLSATRAIGEFRKRRAVEHLGDRLIDGCLVVAASDERSQAQNREAARERMVEILDRALAPPPKTRRPTRPSAGAVDRRIQAKKRRGQTKRMRASSDE